VWFHCDSTAFLLAFLAISREAVNCHFAVYLRKLWTDFNEILEGWGVAQGLIDATGIGIDVDLDFFIVQRGWLVSHSGGARDYGARGQGSYSAPPPP